MNWKKHYVLGLFLVACMLLISNLVLAVPVIVSVNTTDAYSGTPGKVTATIKNSGMSTAFETSVICSGNSVLDTVRSDNYDSGEQKIVSFNFDGNVAVRTQSLCVLKVVDKGNFQTVEQNVTIYINPTIICTPNQGYCEGQKRMICLSDGSKFIEAVNDNSCITPTTQATKTNYYPYLIGIVIILIIIILLLIYKKNK